MEESSSIQYPAPQMTGSVPVENRNRSLVSDLIIVEICGVILFGIGLIGCLYHQGKLPPVLANVKLFHSSSKNHSIAFMCAGGVFSIAAFVGLIKNPKKNDPNQHRDPIFSDSTATSEATAAEKVQKQSSATNQKAVTIGSPENLLDEPQIKEELEKIQSKSLDSLVIYGRNVRLNTDPGILNLNPKKLILIGAEIVHEPSNYRLDDALATNRKWKASRLRNNWQTFVEQMKVASIQEALDHQPPQRNTGFFRTEPYHMVYLVTEKA